MTRSGVEGIRFAASTLRRYSFGIRLTITQADAKPWDRPPHDATTRWTLGKIQPLESRQDGIRWEARDDLDIGYIGYNAS